MVGMRIADVQEDIDHELISKEEISDIINRALRGMGDGWMIHAGNPIGYVNLNTNYWQSHFYTYGRLP